MQLFYYSETLRISAHWTHGDLNAAVHVWFSSPPSSHIYNMTCLFSCLFASVTPSVLPLGVITSRVRMSDLLLLKHKAASEREAAKCGRAVWDPDRNCRHASGISCADALWKDQVQVWGGGAVLCTNQVDSPTTGADKYTAARNCIGSKLEAAESTQEMPCMLSSWSREFLCVLVSSFSAFEFLKVFFFLWLSVPFEAQTAAESLGSQLWNASPPSWELPTDSTFSLSKYVLLFIHSASLMVKRLKVRDRRRGKTILALAILDFWVDNLLLLCCCQV